MDPDPGGTSIEAATNAALGANGSLRREITKLEGKSYPNKDSCIRGMGHTRKILMRLLKKVIDGAAGHDDDQSTHKPSRSRMYQDRPLPAETPKDQRKRQNKTLERGGYAKYPTH